MPDWHLGHPVFDDMISERAEAGKHPTIIERDVVIIIVGQATFKIHPASPRWMDIDSSNCKLGTAEALCDG